MQQARITMNRPGHRASRPSSAPQRPRATNIRQQNLREAVVAGLAILSVASTGLLSLYWIARQTIYAELKATLRYTAALTAANVDPELHDALRDSGQMGSALYRRASQPLLQLRSAIPSVFYAYSLVPRQGALHFVLDSSYYVKNPGDRTPVARLGQVYREAPPEAWQALREGRVTVVEDPYSDAWGAFLSGYAPFRRGDGSVAGVVGVDLSTAQLAAKLRSLRLTLALTLGGTALLAGVAGFARWRTLTSRAEAIEEIARAGRLAEQAAAAAEAASQAKSTFLATMGHEIRTPLNGVLGLTSVLLGTRLNRQQRDGLETIRVSGEALLAILNNILDYATIEEGALKLESQAFELLPLLENALGLYAAEAHGKGIELTLLIDPSVPACIETDPTRLGQILRNLVNNAVKFTDQGDVVIEVDWRVPVAGHGPLLQIAVRDTGPGIPLDRREQLFQPFVQLDGSSQSRHGGTGLGLAICQRLVVNLGGGIRIDSDGVSGTMVVVAIPAVAPPRCAGALPDPADRTLAGRSLLLLARGANRQLLERAASQWDMVWASVGDLAGVLEVLAERSFDLAILDPPLEDPQLEPLVRAIRGQARGRTLPLLALQPLLASLPAPPPDLDATLAKPIRLMALHQALVALLSGQRLSAEPAPEHGVPEARQTTATVAVSFAERHPLRLLIAEDNRTNRKVLDLQLRRLGYAAQFAQDGREAVALQQQFDPDVILMDLRMPGCDGLQATREIRLSAAGGRPPWIVAITANAMAEDQQSAREAGMNDFLAKPISLEGLQRALATAHAALCPPDWNI